MSRRTRMHLATVLICAVSVAAGCGSNTCEPNRLPDLVVTLEASSLTVSPQNPVNLTVRIKNNSDEQLIWGSGSSTCRLWAVVLVEGHELLTVPMPFCTCDFVNYHIEPGETDTQVDVWNGQVWDQGIIDLPAGEYGVVGVAGKLRSEPISIRVLSGL